MIKLIRSGSRINKLPSLLLSPFFSHPYAAAVLRHNPSIQVSMNIDTNNRLVCNVAEASSWPPL